ncbi:hypothetical protein L7F22_013772 [Adiantum nelumboides]|nr:hypothetical protein [Adiantum nelumboides]
MKIMNELQCNDRFTESLHDRLPPERPEDHKIDLIPGSSPPNQLPYRASLSQQEEIMKQVSRKGSAPLHDLTKKRKPFEVHCDASGDCIGAVLNHGHAVAYESRRLKDTELHVSIYEKELITVWTPEVITIWEAGLTVLQFFILVLHAYAQDKSWPIISISFLDQNKRESWIPSEKTFITTAAFTSSPEESSEGIADSEGAVSALLQEGYGHVGAGEMQSWSCTMFLWKQQFKDALTLNKCCGANRKQSQRFCLIYEILAFPWKFLFAFVPPPNVCHGWVAFISSLIFITGISYVVTQLTNLLGDVTGISSFVIALTVLATGASWPDLAASAIAAYRQPTADSAIANITCSNSVNIFIGIGVPWVINTIYNRVVLHDVLRVPAGSLSFILIVYFITFIFCVLVLIARRVFIGGELGGPRKWAWSSSIFILLLWMVFLVLSCLRVYSVI